MLQINYKLWGFLVLFAASASSQGDTIEAFNASATPAPYTWGATEVGWTYVAGQTYDLTSVLTKFGDLVDGRTVTMELYTSRPGTLGSTLIVSAPFTPLADTFAGASFAPVAITAGEDYFVGFRNVSGLSVNVANPGSAVSSLAWGPFNDGSYFVTQTGDFTNNAILSFESTTTATPLPATALGGMALLGGLGIRRFGRLRRTLA